MTEYVSLATLIVILIVIYSDSKRREMTKIKRSNLQSDLGPVVPKENRQPTTP